MSSYVLKSSTEADRLEWQSTLPNYRIEDELGNLELFGIGHILDVGCGTGIATRYLAEQQPKAKVIGCDLVLAHIERAKEVSRGIPNVDFEVANCIETKHPDSSFDLIVARYMLQHLPKDSLKKAFKEFYRLLKPNGKLATIEGDGHIINLHPQTQLVSEVLQKIRASGVISFEIGRVIPSLYLDAGFALDSKQVTALQDDGNECLLMSQRLENAREFLNKVTGSSSKTSQFIQEYLDSMKSPGALYFHNRVVVMGSKPSRLQLVKE